MVVSLRLSVAKDVYTIDLDCRRDCGVGSALRSGVVHVCRGLLLGGNGLSLGIRPRVYLSKRWMIALPVQSIQ